MDRQVFCFGFGQAAPAPFWLFLLYLNILTCFVLLFFLPMLFFLWSLVHSYIIFVFEAPYFTLPGLLPATKGAFQGVLS